MALGFLAACQSDALPPTSKYGTVQGIVLDRATNRPIPGALVTVDTVLKTTTGADGRFSIANVPSGSFDYSVQASGYRPVALPDTVDPSGTKTLTIALDH
jgi:hypothetical protein